MAAAMIESSNNQSACSSPRISFSHDIQHQQEGTIHPQQAAESNDYSRLDKSLLVDEDPAAPEFKFCFDVTTSIDRTDAVDGVSPADELFMNGVLVPINEYHQILTNKSNSNHCKYTEEDDSSQQICGQTKTEPEEEGGERRQVQQQEEKEEIISTTRATLIRESEKSSNYNYSKSFWKFNRSSSLNSSYEIMSNKKTSSTTNSSSFWSLHLLSRSNSTGSSSTPTPIKHKSGGTAAANVSANQKQGLMTSGPKFSSSSSSSSSSHRKPPLMKQQSYNYGGSNSPVLNVPPPYIAKGTSDLLGLASFFRNGGTGKDKKNKKR